MALDLIVFVLLRTAIWPCIRCSAQGCPQTQHSAVSSLQAQHQNRPCCTPRNRIRTPPHCAHSFSEQTREASCPLPPLGSASRCRLESAQGLSPAHHGLGWVHCAAGRGTEGYNSGEATVPTIWGRAPRRGEDPDTGLEGYSASYTMPASFLICIDRRHL